MIVFILLLNAHLNSHVNFHLIVNQNYHLNIHRNEPLYLYLNIHPNDYLNVHINAPDALVDSWFSILLRLGGCLGGWRNGQQC